MPSVVLATASYDHSIRFWEAPSGMCYKTLQFTDSQVNCLAVSPDKQILAAAGHHLIRLFEVNSNNPQPIATLEGHKNNITTMGWQREGKWIYTGSEDHTIRIWDMRTLTCQREYKCETSVNSLSLHPNQGELVCGEQSGVVKVLDLTSNAIVQEVAPEGDVGIRSVSVGLDGRVCAAANNNGNVFVWNIEKTTNETSQLTKLRKFKAHKNYILKCLVSPDCRQLATTSADKTIKLWNLTNLDDIKLQKTLVGHNKWVWDCSYSTDSAYLVTASSDNTARLWDLSRGETIRQYTGHQKPVVCIALNDAPSK